MMRARVRGGRAGAVTWRAWALRWRAAGCGGGDGGCGTGGSTDFLAPVDSERLGLRDYRKLVASPMDLGTVQARLDGGLYPGPQARGPPRP